MTQAERAPQAGVTLIEMLVVLALFAVIAGAVVFALPAQRDAKSAGFDRLTLAARLDTVTRRALTRDEPYAGWQQRGDVVVLLLNEKDRWTISDDPRLNPVKLISRYRRMSFQRDHEDVFPVSAALVPERGERLLIGAEDGDDTYFDGLNLVRAQAEGRNADAAVRERVQPD